MSLHENKVGKANYEVCHWPADAYEIDKAEYDDFRSLTGTNKVGKAEQNICRCLAGVNEVVKVEYDVCLSLTGKI